MPTPSKRRLVHIPEKCISCAACVGVCPEFVLDMHLDKLHLDMDKCTVCGICPRMCPTGALLIEKKTL